MTISLDDIISRSALLISLQKKEKISKKDLEKHLPNWKESIGYLKEIGIEIDETENEIELKSLVSFDLYQSIPSEILNDVAKLIWKLVPQPTVLDPTTMNHKILVPNVVDDSQNEFPCINCADAPCMTYTFDRFGSVDKFPNRVCPADLININENNFVGIDDSACTGCSLCLIRCPFNSIKLKDGVVKIKKFSESDIDNIVEERDVLIDEKRAITDSILNQISHKTKDVVIGNDLCRILDNFDDKVTRPNWDRDKYYIFIRNLFRELGLEASYTGAGGKLRRADVTIESPFLVGIEVKSPAESDVNVSAIRQAMDARLEVSQTYDAELDDTFCAAIAQGIARGAHRRAISNKAYNVTIPIITGRILLYILLKHTTTLPQNAENDLKCIFTDYVGEIDSNVLKNYFENYFNRRIEQIQFNSISLEIPPQITLNDPTLAIQQLEELKKETINEISLCFQSASRIARGSYS